MMPPVRISCIQISSPTFVQPLSMIVIIRAPATVPSTLPTPPDRLAPPMTTAAITFSS